MDQLPNLKAKNQSYVLRCASEFADGVSSPGCHTDLEHYQNPEAFDGFRFVDSSSISTTRPLSTYLVYGNGRHACPGRHFAATLAKLMVIEFLMEYDVEELPKRRRDVGFGVDLLPDLRACMNMKGAKVAV
jgi:cytochrome P450